MTHTFADEQSLASTLPERTTSQTTRVRVEQAPAVTSAPLDMGDAADVGSRITLTSRFVEVDGEPWIPVMGEYHFSRDLPERWETELRKMKAGGVNIVATYLLWILHEEIEGEFRWDGHLDLRAFIALADRVGLKVVIRIGPWAHGETRNGGFPDWLQALPIAHRTDDPDYLELARRWYTSIEEQVRGSFHSAQNPDGPIIGIQVENELYDQRAHIATLRDLAESLGLRASVWTATGWGGAELPEGRVLPVYAGYSDGFWEESDTIWPEFGKMHFTFNTARDDLTVGADLRDSPVDHADDIHLGDADLWPYVTCELGGGMAVAYHRRPLVDPDDVAALALTKLGSGSAWQGYYMYHGGLHVIGALSSTQESHATGYPNDVPVRDYDFSAPLAASGEQRPHFHKLRMQHLMLDAFGRELAPAPSVVAPAVDDGVRWAVRSEGARGFLFANNHQPAIAGLPSIDDVQFSVEFDDATVTVPTRPFTLQTGAYFVWPLRQGYGSIPSLTVTAQPITQITTPEGHLIVFGASRGVDVELQLQGVDAGAIRGASVRGSGDTIIAAPSVAPGVDCAVVIGDTTLVFLDEAAAQSVWRGEVNGRDTVLLWEGSAWFDGEGFVVEPRETAADLFAFPPLDVDSTAGDAAEQGVVFQRHTVVGAGQPLVLESPVFPEAATAPVRTSGRGDRFSAPTDADFETLQEVELAIPAEALRDAQRTLLRLDWTGDVIRVSIGDQLITDQFWYGRPLEVDLAPYRSQLSVAPLRLQAFAWDPATAVYVDPRVRPDADAPVLAVHAATVTPVRPRRVA